MARISSVCPQDAFVFGHWLAAGWSRLSKSLLQAAPSPVAARIAPAPVPIPVIEPARLKRGNLRPASIPALQQSAAWLDLMSQMSHDLRTPLNAVIGLSDVMSTELLGPVGNPRYREYAGDIRDSGRLLLKAAEDTLAMTSLLTQSADRTPETLSITGLAGEAWAYFAADAASRDVSFGLDAGTADDLEILAPAHPLRQALINLFSEAMARCADGGRIVLHAVAEDDTVRFELIVAAARSRTSPGSLAINLARTLLELLGAGLLEIQGQDGSWRAVTVLDRANQRDFFTAARGGDPWGATQAFA